MIISHDNPVENTKCPLHKDVYWQGKQWVASRFGVEKRDGSYYIEADLLYKDNRAYELGWMNHMRQKQWCDLDDFATALLMSLAFSDPEKLNYDNEGVAYAEDILLDLEQAKKDREDSRRLAGEYFGLQVP